MRSTIKRTVAPALYRELRDGSINHLETNDCAVIAVAAVCGVPYAVAHKTLALRGRKSGQGTYIEQTLGALKDLGKSARQINTWEVLAKYPSPHRELLKNVTTHHPRRFPGSFDPNKRYLLRTKRHILAVVGGEVNDYTINMAKRVIAIYEVN